MHQLTIGEKRWHWYAGGAVFLQAQIDDRPRATIVHQQTHSPPAYKRCDAFDFLLQFKIAEDVGMVRKSEMLWLHGGEAGDAIQQP